jgi:indoleamine 2,3-dioxygenase
MSLESKTHGDSLCSDSSFVSGINHLSHDVWVVGSANGFLPNRAPINSLPLPFHPLERLVLQLPQVTAGGSVRRRVEGLVTIPNAVKLLNHDSAQLERAMLLYAFVSHAYIVESKPPTSEINDNNSVMEPSHLPPQLSVPWLEICETLGRPPVMSYGSYILYNWRKYNASLPISLENIAPLHTYLGSVSSIVT